MVRLTESLVPRLSAGIVVPAAHGWVALIAPGGLDAGELVALLPPPESAEWDGSWIRFPEELTASWTGDSRSGAALALRDADGELLGAYIGVRHQVETIFTLLAGRETLFGVALRMALLVLADERNRATLRAAAEVDPLSGLLNRAGLEYHGRRLAADGTNPPKYWASP